MESPGLSERVPSSYCKLATAILEGGPDRGRHQGITERMPWATPTGPLGSRRQYPAHLGLARLHRSAVPPPSADRLEPMEAVSPDVELGAATHSQSRSRGRRLVAEHLGAPAWSYRS
jgi:hypothetical protein